MPTWKVFNVCNSNAPGGIDSTTCWGEIEFQFSSGCQSIRAPWMFPSKSVIVIPSLTNPDQWVTVDVELPQLRHTTIDDASGGDWNKLPDIVELTIGFWELTIKKEILNSEWHDGISWLTYIPWEIKPIKTEVDQNGHNYPEGH